MTQEEFNEQLSQLIDKYILGVREELAERWKSWQKDLNTIELYEVIGGLLARQVTLTIQLAKAPEIWNGHIAPLILRGMADAYITIAWIFKEQPLDRARKFILEGIGQEKLILEHWKNYFRDKGKNPDEIVCIQDAEKWINTFRYTFLTEVNVGSWSGIDTRKMAEEADCMDIYRLRFQQYSAATHNMWPHIARFNLMQCESPLHRYHFIPYAPDSEYSEFDYLRGAMKMLQKTFDLFDKNTGVSVATPTALNKFEQAMTEWNAQAGKESQAESASKTE